MLRLSPIYACKTSSWNLTPPRRLSSYDDGEENAAHPHMMIYGYGEMRVFKARLGEIFLSFLTSLFFLCTSMPINTRISP